eukprot:6208780-Amphidinium_carterae.1
MEHLHALSWSHAAPQSMCTHFSCALLKEEVLASDYCKGQSAERCTSIGDVPLTLVSLARPDPFSATRRL